MTKIIFDAESNVSRPANQTVKRYRAAVDNDLDLKVSAEDIRRLILEIERLSQRRDELELEHLGEAQQASGTMPDPGVGPIIVPKGYKGHGHVIPNADGSKARCGGEKMCRVC